MYEEACYPYERYENLKAWDVLEQAITNLIENKDLEQKTSKPYIIGYIIKVLLDNNCLIVNPEKK